MNKTLKLLIASDVFLFGGFGLISPIFAIFMNDNLVGGSIFSAGLASTIFLITHSVLQIIFAYKFNPKDRIWMLLLGTGIIAVVPFCYLAAVSVYHIYLIQFVYGIGAAFAYPSWSSIFTSNLEKGQRGFQWSIYSSSVGIGTAITAAVGAWLAEMISFHFVFVLTGLFGVASLLILLILDKKVLKKV